MSVRQRPLSRTDGVIVYLTQKRHSSYGTDSLAQLKQSVALLYKHYNAAHQDDVIFFHDAVDEASQQRVLALCDTRQSTARFMNITSHFKLPFGVPDARCKEVIFHRAASV